MGLFDSILGSLTGQSGAAGAGSSLIPALINIMASRAGGGSAIGNQPAGIPGAGGGGLGEMVGNMLGGGGQNMGSGVGGLGGGALASGLGQLLQQFQQSGHGNIANSWVGTGENQSISPGQVGQALGPDTLDQLSQQTGMGHADITSQLSQLLPQLVDQLTPNGHVPTPDQAERHW